MGEERDPIVTVSVLKSELTVLRSELKSELTVLKSELNSELTVLKSELNSELTVLRSELNSEMTVLSSELKSAVAELEQRIIDDNRTTRRHFDIMVEKVNDSVRLVAEVTAHHSTVLGDHETRLQKIEKLA